MDTLQPLFEQALHLHQTGNLLAADAIYQQIIAKQPHHFLAWHYSGVVAAQNQQAERAVSLIGRALEIDNQNPEAFYNLGLALQDLKRNEEALANFKQAILLKPDYAAAFFSQGNALQNLLHHDQAINSYVQAINLQPNYPEAHFNLGLAKQKLNQFAAALNCFEKVLGLQPAHAEAYFLAAICLEKLKRIPAAVYHYQQAVRLNPDNAVAHNNLGNIYLAQRNYSAALKSYQRTLELLPDSPEVHNNIGNALKRLNHHQPALEHYRQAITFKPDYAEAYNNCGTVLQNLKQYEPALQNYHTAIHFKPDYAYAYWNLGLLKLLKGDFIEGWQLFEWRWQGILSDPTQKYPQAKWLGEESITGETILIHTEQGFGDIIQFCRYTLELEKLGANVIISSPASLTELLATLGNDIKVITTGTELPAFAWQCPMLSLPMAFKTTLANIPAQVPYLSPPPQKQQEWQTRLGKKTVLRVGIAWSGTAAHFNNLNRSIPLPLLLPILQLPFAFHSLQKEYPQAEHELLSQLPQIHNHAHELNDFSDTSALISAMDIVISVDTAVAHLAGALAKPVWILLPYAPDYRWLLDREDSPWYPTAILHRQPQPGDWHTVITAIADKLLALSPSNQDAPALSLEQLFANAVACHQAGKLSTAIQHYQTLLAIQPNHLPALHYCGVIHAQLHNPERALELIGKALTIDAQQADAQLNYGLACYELQRYEEALASFSLAIAINPDYSEAYFNRGNALQKLQRYDAALANYERALAQNPHYIDVYINRGITLQCLKLLETAQANFERLVLLTPNSPLAYNHLANVHQDLQQFAIAIGYYNKAIALQADYAEAWHNRAVALQQLKDYDAALASFTQAITLKPDYAEAYANRGHILKRQDKHSAALADYEKTLELQPNYAFLAGECLHLKMKNCDWQNLENSLELLTDQIYAHQKASPPFPLLAISDDLNCHKQAAEIWSAANYPVVNTLPPVPRYPQHTKIRIGYFSADFCNHAVTLLTAELFETHDRTKFSVLGFSTGNYPDDAIKARLTSGFDEFIDVHDLTDQQIVELARSKELDIAIDLGGHTGNNRVGIFALRAAPVQVSYLGYVATLGVDYMDYILADHVIIPTALQKYYTEKIAYLPCYQVNDSKRRSVDRQFSRQQLGLPEHGMVFCCFNKNYKITPDVFASWMRILQGVKDSVLLLYAENRTVIENLTQAATAQGIATERLIFGKLLTFSDYLARYLRVDLFLDTRPYNAGATASDALWMGLPVLTCTGQSFASRMGASLLMALDLPELITANLAEYETRAMALGNHPVELAKIKHKLQQNRKHTLLFNTQQTTRHIENAFIHMHQRSCANLAPAHIDVSITQG